MGLFSWLVDEAGGWQSGWMHSCNLSLLTSNHLQLVIQSRAYHCWKAKRTTAIMYFLNVFPVVKEKLIFTLSAMWQATWKFCQWSEYVKIQMYTLWQICFRNVPVYLEQQLSTVLVQPKWQSKAVWNKFKWIYSIHYVYKDIVADFPPHSHNDPHKFFILSSIQSKLWQVEYP